MATKILSFRDTPLFARRAVSIVSRVERGIYHTSQWSRIAERPPTTDSSGGKTSADSLTRLMASLVAEYVVDFQFDPFSSVAPDSMVGSEGFRLFSILSRSSHRLGWITWVAWKNGQIDPLSTVVHITLGSWFFKIEGTGVGVIKDSTNRS